MGRRWLYCRRVWKGRRGYHAAWNWSIKDAKWKREGNGDGGVGWLLKDGGGSAAGGGGVLRGAKVKVVSCCDGDGHGERRRGGPPDSQVRMPGAGQTGQAGLPRARLEEGGNLNQRTRAVRRERSGQRAVSSERAARQPRTVCVFHTIPARQGQAQARALPFRRRYSSQPVNCTCTLLRSTTLAHFHPTLHFMSGMRYPITCTAAR